LVLSGSIREFILADVFQLLAQQKITGKLVLDNGSSEGQVVFRNGLIAGAETNEERVSLKLFNYLTGIRRQSSRKARELFAAYEGDINATMNEIVRRNYMVQEEMDDFVNGIVEDLTCTLFLWKSGTYRFSSLKSVDTIAPINVAISTETIAMEGMRRLDEWMRMQEYIQNDTVFVPAEKKGTTIHMPSDPQNRPEEYIYRHIDGASTVGSIIHDTCLTEYHVYEALNELIKQKRIAPLSPRYSQSVKAAIEKKQRENKFLASGIPLHLLTVAGIILIILFIGLIMFRGVIFSEKSNRAEERKKVLYEKLKETKTSALVLQKRISGEKKTDHESLKRDPIWSANSIERDIIQDSIAYNESE